MARRPLAALGAIGLFLGLIAPAQAAATDEPAAGTPLPQPTREVVYKRAGDATLKLGIFEPEEIRPGQTYPALVLFFGGGWTSGTPSQFYPQCAWFASRGMIAITPDYRTAKKDHVSPRECVEDAKSAMRWIRAHAAELHLDPQRIAAGGGSAGGHLAAATACITAYDAAGDDLTVSPRPDALVLFNPVLDNGPDNYGYDRVKDYYQTFSPAHNVRPGLPPTLIMVGTKDQLIPGKTMENYRAAMLKAGNRCELIFYPDQVHGFFNFRDGHNPYYDQTLAAADAFLVSTGFLAAQGEAGK